LPEDVAHIAPTSGFDKETQGRILKVLMPYQFLAVGSVTKDYPLLLSTCLRIKGIVAGETRRKFNEP